MDNQFLLNTLDEPAGQSDDDARAIAVVCKRSGMGTFTELPKQQVHYSQSQIELRKAQIKGSRQIGDEEALKLACAQLPGHAYLALCTPVESLKTKVMTFTRGAA